jgi:hypothetical protein
MEEDSMLIYQYKPEFTGRHRSSGGEEEDFEQTYIFSGAHIWGEGGGWG